MGHIPDDQTAWGFVRTAFLFRGLNQYRAIVSLLKTNHWEDTLILIRSLFELLLNAEELARLNQQVERAATQFCQFFKLQNYLEWRELTNYEIATGRAHPDAKNHVARLDKIARRVFSPFWYTDKKGRGKWRSSWCNKTVADLCAASSNPMRMQQYRLFYSSGSQFSHSSPIAVFAQWVPKDQHGDWSKEIAVSDSKEKREILLAGTFSSIVLFELLTLKSDHIPSYDAMWVNEKAENFKKFWLKGTGT